MSYDYNELPGKCLAFTSLQKRANKKIGAVTTPGVEKVKQGCEVDDQTEEKVNHSGAGTD